MSDPRTEPGFKHKRHDDKVILLLGAILDELIVSRKHQDGAAPRKRGRPPKVAE